MRQLNNTHVQEVSIPEGLYERVDILEYRLFDDDHLRKIAQTVSEVSDKYDGVCFVVWKYGITSDLHLLYVPFKADNRSHMTFDTLTALVTSTTCKLAEQLKEGVTFH